MVLSCRLTLLLGSPSSGKTTLLLALARRLGSDLQEGMMQPRDEETREFFKHSSVICVVSPCYASNKLSFIKQQVVGTIYTHHQKCVLVDTQTSGTKAPRQLWHDLHCKIEGPAAYDVLINFIQRWRKEMKWKWSGLWFERVNRIRELPQNNKIVATHTDSPDVLIWDIEAPPNHHAVYGATESHPDLVCYFLPTTLHSPMGRNLLYR